MSATILRFDRPTPTLETGRAQPGSSHLAPLVVHAGPGFYSFVGTAAEPIAFELATE